MSDYYRGNVVVGTEIKTTNYLLPKTKKENKIKDRLFVDGVLQLTGVLRDETVVEVMKNDLGS